MKNLISDDLRNELSDLKVRALNIGYKNQLPRFPKDQRTQKAFDNLMIGFQKRLDNWKSGLVQLENPGGLPSMKKPVQTEVLSYESQESIHFVMNSFEELSK